MNFLMNFCSHLQIVASLLIGGWIVHTDQLAMGGVVAFISAVGRLNDPCGRPGKLLQGLQRYPGEIPLARRDGEPAPRAPFFRSANRRRLACRLER
jgi:ABC-type multidrug transport system fused ATPase/permease subunit